MRFQADAKALTFGYQNVNDPLNINPRIEWIGNGASLGDLEFRVADSFNSTVSRLVATMRKDGNIAFGENVGVNSYGNARLQIGFDGPANTDLRGVSIIRTNGNIGALNSTALFSIARGQSVSNVGVSAQADGSGQAFGLQGVGRTTNNGGCGVFGRGGGSGNFFTCGVYGTFESGSTNNWAGFFDGNIGCTGAINPSDVKLKNNIKLESAVLEKIAKLRQVTYDYKDISEMNLPRGIQHGFISQELATVFPEITQDISKPVYDSNNLVTGYFEYKGLNYVALISVLTAGIQELNNELKTVKQELSDIKSSSATATANNQGFFMEQNIPNPFVDQTVVRYKLPNGTTTAEIAVFDMTGKPVKSYVVNNSQTEVIIKSSEIGTGLFIYSLVQNGQELITKRLIVK